MNNDNKEREEERELILNKIEAILRSWHLGKLTSSKTLYRILETAEEYWLAQNDADIMMECVERAKDIISGKLNSNNPVAISNIATMLFKEKVKL